MSGRIAAILPLPALASEDSDDIVEKSLVNDEAVTLGVPLELLPPLDELDDELELDLEELPHAAMAPTIATTSNAVRARAKLTTHLSSERVP